ncbi:hypothetical protein [bacterium endosymbiont of Bathymodiolus sp. 5 South]|jgi:hypothetical protein|uniref:hypothetical protein n=1 Tax=bacterium endosymbiont of Bathymodiolus sp. 5 South TaxID=1181670 RepID=UPI00214C786A|nr:hypothetical protein [bacterium endosymbiont of Bathymodiolus sp. 5 South]
MQRSHYVYDYQGNRVRSVVESNNQVQSQRDYLPLLDLSTNQASKATNQHPTHRHPHPQRNYRKQHPNPLPTHQPPTIQHLRVGQQSPNPQL